MPTFNRTFRVVTGIDVANTVVLDANRNLSNITSINASTFVTSSGLNVTTQANNAYDRANTATTVGQSAYGQANLAYGQANTATTIAQNAYAQANSEPIAKAAYGQANNAYDRANSALTVAQNAYAQANNEPIAKAAYGQANNAYDRANTATTVGQAAYGQANNAYDRANSALTVAQNAYAQANNEPIAKNAYAQANTSGNTTRVSVNSASTLSNRQLNFVNSAKIQVQITDSGDGNANVTFTTTGLVGSGNGSVNSITAGYGLNSFPNPIVDIGTISANIASTTTAGVVKLIDAIDSTDTANAATANAVTWLRTTISNDSNAAANLVAIYANNSLRVANANINFNNTSTINVSVSGAANRIANVEFSVNPTGSGISAAYNQANTATTVAQNAYAQANNEPIAKAAYGQANLAYGQANTATTVAQNAYNQANSGVTIAGNAYGQANNARLTANNAYDTANLKLNLTGGTISGSLNISGNLVITGNTNYINVSTYSVQDPLIFLAANNITSDIVDIGFIATKNTNSVLNHTGLARDASDGTWYLFDNLPDNAHENNVINFANTNLATLRTNINANSILLVGNVVATQANLTLAHNQANTATTVAQNAYAQANNEPIAKAAYGQANTATTVGQAAYGQANNAYGAANNSMNYRGAVSTDYTDANTNYQSALLNGFYSVNGSTDSRGTLVFNSFGSVGPVQLEFAYQGSMRFRNRTDNTTWTAFKTVWHSGNYDAYGQANSATTAAQAAYGQANTATTVAQNAYAQANNEPIAKAAYGQANLAYGQANTATTVGQAAYGQANLAYGQANTATTIAQNAYAQANNEPIAKAAYGQANNAYDRANTGVTVGSAAYGQANLAYGQANSATTVAQNAYNQANSATTVAQNAYGTANNRVLKAGDTMTGQLNISSGGLVVTGGDVGIGTASPTYKLEVNGSFAANTKSFVINHPTKQGYKLRYGSLEGPENGVYLRGRLTSNSIIDLPEYWTKLVDESSITVTLTPIGKHQKLYIDAIADNKVIIGNDSMFGSIDCFFVVYGERIDVEKLIPEYPVGG